jgi:chromosome segregation ATPase
MRRGVLILAAFLSGCTIAELQRQERAGTERVRLKEVNLHAEQERTDALSSQKEQLTAELSHRQVSLDELNARVDQLQAANARDYAANDAARLERQRLIGKIRELNVQLVALQQSTDTATEQKQQRIEYLKQQVSAQLDLLLH